MTRRQRILSCAAAITVPLAWLNTFGAIGSAQQTPPAVPPPLVQPPATGGATATPAPVDSATEIPLGHTFESLRAGISFRPPADCKLLNEIDGNYIAEWTDEARDWTLKLGQMTLDRPRPLVTGKGNFDEIEGVMNRTLDTLKSKIPGCKVLRNNLTNTRDGWRPDPKHPEIRDALNNVGLIAIRYTNQGQRRLSQQAIIQASTSVYYVITLTTPGSKALTDDAPDDPGEVLAANTFSQMIDTVRLLDRSAIRENQVHRFLNSRAIMVNWTSDRIHSILKREQWLRIVKNGKDVGYSYITEETAAAIPRRLTAKEMQEAKAKDIHGPQDFKKPGDGVLIGVRACVMTEAVRSDKTKGIIQTDSASWFFVSADKKHEDFSRVVVTDDHIAPTKGYVQEFGVSNKLVKHYVFHPDQQKTNNPTLPAAGGVNPEDDDLVGTRDDWELDVNQATMSGAAEPLVRKLPTFYISQTLSHLLPRLVPLDKPDTYLFATYVSDAREIVLRYIDVMPEQRITFNGVTQRAIPISDHLGLEGSVTFHYMTIDGRYLGSENKDLKMQMFPSDADTLMQIWKNANLTRPGEVERTDGVRVEPPPQR